MDAIRSHKLLARLVLAWFVLFVGVSVASPIIKPSDTQLICSASGTMKLVAADAADGEGQGKTGVASMDCPLCTPLGLALPTPHQSPVVPSALAHALHPVAAAHLAWLTRSPLPARGPPSLS